MQQPKYMKKIIKNTVKIFDLLKNYLPSLYGGFKKRKLFENVELYCMFIGYPRSGHSLIGSLLDAHPNIIIAHQLGALKYTLTKFSKKQIFHLLIKRSQLYAESKMKRGGYLYYVPNQWQGRFIKLQVIGDKDGDGSTLRLQARPWLLSHLRKTIDCKIKFIHIVRNPYDNISTVCMKAGEHNLNPDLKECIEYYFSLCATVVSIKKHVESTDIFELRHESFIVEPKDYLKKLCQFLGVEPYENYLNDCASIVYKSPHKSRYNIQWSNELIEMVKNKIQKFPFLHGYAYEEQ